MPDQQIIAQARIDLEEASKRLYGAKLLIQKTQDPAALASAQQELATINQNYQQAKTGLQSVIQQFYEQQGHKQAASELKASIPVLMLPVRIETRFVPAADNRLELWVRIYPDDLHIHAHERLLTESEQTAGRQYWLTLLNANRENNNASEDVKKEAWSTLYKGPGIQRALWIAKQTQPLNWTPDLNVPAEQLQFPEEESKTHVWTQAPRTQLLPDKFEVSIFRNNSVEPVHTQVGALIPDTVFLGPDPLLAKDAFTKTGQSIEPDDSFAWITNFDKAVEQGLAMKIKVEDHFLNHNQIDRLVVMGLLSTASPAEGKEFVEQMIENHHYSSRGFSFLAQGSPTNNTESTPSSYKKNEDYLPKGYYDGSMLNNLAAVPNAEGNQMAEALGINASVFGQVNNASMVESFNASAMNTALYSATIGYYMEVLASPMINGRDQANLRQFFTRYVTASGPLAAIRVGDQPYGVLVTSNLNQWNEPDTDRFYEGLTHVLRTLQSKWKAISNTKVAHVHKNGDPSELLLEILGLEAGSVTYDQRLGHLPDVPLGAKNITGAESAFASKQGSIFQFLQTLGFTKAEKQGLPLISFINFYEFLNNIGSNTLLDGKEPSDDRFLGEWGKDSNMNYIEWLAQTKEFNNIHTHLFKFKQRVFITRPPRYILYLLLRHALLQELTGAAEEYYLKSDVPFLRGAYEKSYVNFNKEFKDLTTWEVLNGVPSTINADQLKVNQPIGDYILNLPEKHEDSRHLGEMRKAMQVIAKLPTSRLHKYLSDHIDLCSYRLDAWQMGLFNRRLQNDRAKEPEGIYIGAYGWVENLRIASKEVIREVPEKLKPDNENPVYRLSANAGFVQTPSLNHATAAGLLMAGYQNHATRSDPGDFAVNLSSQRVRRALFIYEGIQNNQLLEALLGYQFERALHDATTANPANNLNQYILSLREKFPINNSSIPQQGTEAQETVPAYSVVNGLSIVQAKDEELQSIVTNANHLALIIREKNSLDDVLDALNDLLISETAYQAVQGKTDRTAGLLNAMKHAELPPDLEMHKTPRSSHLSFTSRVSIHFNPLAPQAVGSGWPTQSSPRSLMEGGVNHWLGTVIGNPAHIVATVSLENDEGVVSNTTTVTLSELKLQPIDLTYLVGTDMQTGAKELERLIEIVYASKVTVTPDSKIRISFDPEIQNVQHRSVVTVLPLLRALRFFITTGRPVNALDFAPKLRSVRDQSSAPPAFNIEDLTNRVKTALTSLTTELEQINNIALPNETTSSLKVFFELYYTNGAPVEFLENIILAAPAINRLEAFLQIAALYGVKITYPQQVNSTPGTYTANLLQSAAALWKAMNEKIRRATQKLEQSTTESNPEQQLSRLTEAVKAILGDDFIAIPLFRYSNPEDVAKILGDKGEQLLKHINTIQNTTNELAMETWLESIARVRPAMSRLEQIRIIAEAQSGSEIGFQAAQLPFREKDSWLAVEFPATVDVVNPETNEVTKERFDILNDTIAFAIHGEQASKVNEFQSALLIDEWTESIPNDKEITGISFNYDQPNASAPNAVLLAVEPTGAERWNWDTLLGIVNDTLDRAKTRAVEPAHLMEDPVLDDLLPMTVARFDTKEANTSLDYLVASDRFFDFISQHDYELYKAYKA